MKLWQVYVCLAEEKSILEKFFNKKLFTDYQEEIPQELILEALSKSNKKFYITETNSLREYPERNNYIKENTKSYGNILTILEAFSLYGGDAITEVFDYGSYSPFWS